MREGKLHASGVTTSSRYVLRRTSGNENAPFASVTTSAGLGVVPSPAYTLASAPGRPPLPAPLTSISRTRTPPTPLSLRDSYTNPPGSTQTVPRVTEAPQPVISAVTRSPRVVESTPSPIAELRRPVVVGAPGSTRKRPECGVVSVASNDSRSPVACELSVMRTCSMLVGSRSQPRARASTSIGSP